MNSLGVLCVSVLKILDKQVLKARFLGKLQLFCFFHLGADADAQVEEQEDHLEIHLNHHRVDPLQFRVSYRRLSELVEDPAQLECFMLEEIAPHRR